MIAGEQKSKISVDVIVCTRNRANLLKRCLDSIYNQKHVDLFIYVINDSSIDNTDIVINYYLDKYSNIFYLYNLKREGVASSSNKGIKMGTSKYIALIGDDDYWIDDYKLKSQVDFLEGNTNITLCGTNWITKNGDVYKKIKSKTRNIKNNILVGGGIVCGSTALMNRNCVEKIGGFDNKQKKGTDSDLFRRLFIEFGGIKIMSTYSTIVDINHGLVRMSPNNDQNAILLTIKTRIYNKRKLKNLNQLTDKIEGIYLEKIGNEFYKLFRKTRARKHKLISYKYFKKSLLKKVRFMPLMKLCYISVLGR